MWLSLSPRVKEITGDCQRATAWAVNDPRGDAERCEPHTVGGSSWCPAGAPQPVVSLTTSCTKPASVSARSRWQSERGSWACPLPQMYQSLECARNKKKPAFIFTSFFFLLSNVQMRKGAEGLNRSSPQKIHTIMTSVLTEILHCGMSAEHFHVCMYFFIIWPLFHQVKSIENSLSFTTMT